MNYVMISKLPIIFCLFWDYTDATKINFENLTHVANDSFLDPIVLSRKNELIFVSFPKVNSKLIPTIKSNSSNMSCEFEIDNPYDRIFQTPRANVLGNGKIVVTFIEIRQKDPLKDPEVFVDFYVVNFDKVCSQLNFSLLIDYKVLISYDPLVIIPYMDSFDVFVASLMHCKPAGSMCMIR